MNRTFQSKVGWWYWIVIAVTSFLLFFFFWEHYSALTIFTALVVIFLIEMLIHTQYVFTADQVLKVETGRFVRSVDLEIDRIVSIRKVRSLTVMAPALSFFRLEITYQGHKRTGKVQISPRNEEEFIRYLLKKNPAVKVEAN